MRQLKNGTTPTNQMSKANLFRKVCVAILSILLFASCQKSNNNGQQTQESLNEQTEYYKYFNAYNSSGKELGWIESNKKVIFRKKGIEFVSLNNPEASPRTYIIAGEPIYDKDNDCTIYNVYYNILGQNEPFVVARYKDKITILSGDGESYSIFQKNKP